MRGVSIKAVVLATIATMGVDIVGGLLLMSAIGGDVFTSTLSDEQMQAATKALTTSHEFLIPALVLGTLTTVLGGYIAARIAKSLPYMNAFAFGLLGIAIGWALRVEEMPLWADVIGFSVTLPAAVVGGHIAKRRA